MPYRDPPDRHDAQIVRVATADFGEAGRRVLVQSWIAWAAVVGLGSLAVATEGIEPAARIARAVALALLGGIPAWLGGHVAARHARRDLRLDRDGLWTDDSILIDFEKPLDACIVRSAREAAFVIAQEGRRIVLHGADLDDTLGTRDAWGRRWHEASEARTGHHLEALNGESPWPAVWSVSPDATMVAGEVEPTEALARLAERARDATERHGGALLVVPTAHPEHPLVRIDTDGVLHAFGEHVDTRSTLERTYVWAMGKRNDRGDADAMIVQGADDAVRLSTTATPGRWPALSGLPGATVDLPAPDVPPEEILSPGAFGAIDGFLDEVLVESEE